MPFTFSHPLFAVPLRRIAPKWLSVTGLALGSMIPDMEYFMAMESYQTIGHSFLGFLVQGLPLSIATAFAFHLIVKPVLPKLFPAAGGIDQFVKSLTGDWQLRSGRTWLVFLISLLLGYWTHIFMDAWTHGTGIYVEWIPALHRKYVGEPLYQLLQYGFSLIGVIVPALLLLNRYIRWRIAAKPRSLPAVETAGMKLLLWVYAAGFGFILFAVKLLFSMNRSNIVSVAIVAPLSAALFGILAASMLYTAARNGSLAKGIGAVVLLLLTMSSLKILAILWPGLLPNGHYWMSRPKGEFIPLWCAFIWCWSIMLLICCRMIAGKRRTVHTGQARLTRPNRMV
ncbi:DUF4184 family protein [Paenibacillus sp. R14(2021)]|uniref:DUF4184 family protein n=1 Tax=Paenibacillus sp. R14(2021) TaxID=2859228 RepID=UPI001C6137E5|nr:DUF4184 family protein [Paenibacillus sp. R14(2021)]